MNKRSKSEQRAYLDGCEMIAMNIEKYLSEKGKHVLYCLLSVVRVAVTESEDNDVNDRF